MGAERLGHSAKETGDGGETRGRLAERAQPALDCLLQVTPHCRVEQRLFTAERVVQAGSIESGALLEITDGGQLGTALRENVSCSEDDGLWVEGQGPPGRPGRARMC